MHVISRKLELVNVDLVVSRIYVFFLDLRIELLEPEQNGPIVHTLYGLLMLLPQSEAFHTLRRRLECVNHVAHLRPFTENRYSNLFNTTVLIGCFN